jgi:hypothetical protein
VGAVFFVRSRFNRNAVMPSSLKFQQRPVFYFTNRVSLEEPVTKTHHAHKRERAECLPDISHGLFRSYE